MKAKSHLISTTELSHQRNSPHLCEDLLNEALNAAPMTLENETKNKMIHQRDWILFRPDIFGRVIHGHGDFP